MSFFGLIELSKIAFQPNLLYCQNNETTGGTMVEMKGMMQWNIGN